MLESPSIQGARHRLTLFLLCPIPASQGHFQVFSARSRATKFADVLYPPIRGYWNGTSLLARQTLMTEEQRAKTALDFGGLELDTSTFYLEPFSIQDPDGSWRGIEVGIIRILVSTKQSRVF